MITIRTDANKSIATGHLMRTLTIARECLHLNIPISFIFADTESEKIFKKINPDWSKFNIKILNTQYDKPETELDKLFSIITNPKPTCIIIDSYFITPRYLTEINKKVRTIYLDDLNLFDHPVDMVINYCINAENLYTQSAHKEKKYLLGTKYVPIRNQFRNTSYQVKQKITDILITTGGADDENIISKIIDATCITLDNSVNCHVVIGMLNKHRENLSKTASKNPKIIIYENHLEMASLMQKCDLAISAAGSTIYELCAIGVPTICFTTADNQIPNATGLAANKALIYAKDKDFATHINKLANDYQQRKKLSETMQNLVDGYGASRIVSQLLS